MTPVFQFDHDVTFLHSRRCVCIKRIVIVLWTLEHVATRTVFSDRRLGARVNAAAVVANQRPILDPPSCPSRLLWAFFLSLCVCQSVHVPGEGHETGSNVFHSLWLTQPSTSSSRVGLQLVRSSTACAVGANVRAAAASASYSSLTSDLNLLVIWQVTFVKSEGFLVVQMCSAFHRLMHRLCSLQVGFLLRSLFVLRVIAIDQVCISKSSLVLFSCTMTQPRPLCLQEPVQNNMRISDNQVRSRKVDHSKLVSASGCCSLGRHVWYLLQRSNSR